MKRFLSLAVMTAAMACGQFPTPSVPGPYSTCLPANVAGPQLPICFTRPVAAVAPGGGAGVSTSVVIGAASTVAVFYLAKTIRRHRRHPVVEAAR